jgi:hypothetical protein
MCIELLLIPRCPNEAAAVEVLKEALALAGLDSMDVPIVVITSQADADQSGFVGSPSVFFHGRDCIGRS